MVEMIFNAGKQYGNRNRKVFPLHIMSSRNNPKRTNDAEHSRITKWQKEYFRRSKLMKEVWSKKRDPDENLAIIHYFFSDQDQIEKSQRRSMHSSDASILQLQRDESSIFDSAWATLQGEPWQNSSSEHDDK